MNEEEIKTVNNNEEYSIKDEDSQVRFQYLLFFIKLIFVLPVNLNNEVSVP